MKRDMNIVQMLNPDSQNTFSWNDYLKTKTNESIGEEIPSSPVEKAPSQKSELDSFKIDLLKVQEQFFDDVNQQYRKYILLKKHYKARAVIFTVIDYSDILERLNIEIETCEKLLNISRVKVKKSPKIKNKIMWLKSKEALSFMLKLLIKKNIISIYGENTSLSLLIESHFVNKVGDSFNKQKIANEIPPDHMIKWHLTEALIIYFFDCLMDNSIVNWREHKDNIFATIEDNFLNKKGQNFKNSQLAQVRFINTDPITKKMNPKGKEIIDILMNELLSFINPPKISN